MLEVSSIDVIFKNVRMGKRNKEEIQLVDQGVLSVYFLRD